MSASWKPIQFIAIVIICHFRHNHSEESMIEWEHIYTVIDDDAWWNQHHFIVANELFYAEIDSILSFVRWYISCKSSENRIILCICITYPKISCYTADNRIKRGTARRAALFGTWRKQQNICCMWLSVMVSRRTLRKLKYVYYVIGSNVRVS